MWRCIRSLFCLLCLLVSASGCYLRDAGATQLWLLNDQRDIGQAWRVEADPARRRMLATVPYVRRFARDVMQLRPRRSYRGYVATEAEGLTHVLVASERLRFVPHTWWFPIAGEVAYKSHFSAAAAEAEAEALRGRGYDTWVGHSRAYSTLGMLRDPVVTTMMNSGSLSFMEVLLHEMAHARLYVAGQTDFNEQLASFVAQQGMRQLLHAERFAGTGMRERFEADVVRRRTVEGEVAASLASLEALYARGLPEAEVLVQRQRIFDRITEQMLSRARAVGVELSEAQREMNNARLLQWRRYGRSVDLFEQMWQRAAGSWPRFWKRVERHAAAL